jgi:hypothetical protein
MAYVFNHGAKVQIFKLHIANPVVVSHNYNTKKVVT